MKVVTVVGARPQFIKAAPLSVALRRAHREVLVHTGQHYDAGMSAVFFDELGIPEPDHNLGVGSGPHGEQTGAMLAPLEAIMQAERPDAVVVYGDTNSTLAGALVAAKLGIPIAHVEAGLRSFNRAMPEEVNRIVTDHLSAWLLVPSAVSARQLRDEGVAGGIHVVGDIMYDAVRQHGRHAADRSRVLETVGVVTGGYAACTVHRAENTDDAGRLGAILEGLGRLGVPVVLPLHPRTRARLERAGLTVSPAVRVVEPLGYLDMLRLVEAASLVLTDSGGLQKEAYYLGTPCVTLREETEWVETVTAGWNVLAGADAGRIAAAASAMRRPPSARPDLYGDGDTARRIVEVLETPGSGRFPRRPAST